MTKLQIKTDRDMQTDQKIELLYNAIDAIINAVESTDIDAHFFLTSENSVVYKLRTEIFRLEDHKSPAPWEKITNHKKNNHGNPSF